MKMDPYPPLENLPCFKNISSEAWKKKLKTVGIDEPFLAYFEFNEGDYDIAIALADREDFLAYTGGGSPYTTPWSLDQSYCHVARRETINFLPEDWLLLFLKIWIRSHYVVRDLKHLFKL